MNLGFPDRTRENLRRKKNQLYIDRLKKNWELYFKKCISYKTHLDGTNKDITMHWIISFLDCEVVYLATLMTFGGKNPKPQLSISTTSNNSKYLMKFCTNRQCINSGPKKMIVFLQIFFYHPFSSHPLSYPISKDTWTQLLYFNMMHPLLKPKKHTIHSAMYLLKHFFWEPLLVLTIPSRLTHVWQGKRLPVMQGQNHR